MTKLLRGIQRKKGQQLQQVFREWDGDGNPPYQCTEDDPWSSREGDYLPTLEFTGLRFPHYETFKPALALRLLNTCVRRCH